ncbi:hypothetical protein AB595_19650 [Massilia sp. WF1]|nr:hypothetical protein AM586_17530 [Massilia sp. WG5]KLU35204.1 hypothetical protein AB595_19650 [Massilia sp. WF1]
MFAELFRELFVATVAVEKIQILYESAGKAGVWAFRMLVQEQERRAGSFDQDYIGAFIRLRQIHCRSQLLCLAWLNDDFHTINVG